jgi:transketolase
MRKSIIENSYKAGACHIGSALSCVEILVDIYFNKLKENDVFIFSKASGVSAFYSVLAQKGIIPQNKVAFYLKKYPLPNKNVPGCLFSVGSLGHGLPFAVGMALKSKGNIYILLGEAEVQEGTFWECLLFKRQHKLKNLKIIIDNNGLQALGKVKDILELPYSFLKQNGVMVVKTIKGKGISFLENKVLSHYLNLDKNGFEKAILQLNI